MMCPGATELCPISFPDNESAECLRLEHAKLEAHEQFQASKKAIGVGDEGWVPPAYHEDAKEHKRKLKAEMLSMQPRRTKRGKIFLIIGCLMIFLSRNICEPGETRPKSIDLRNILPVSQMCNPF